MIPVEYARPARDFIDELRADVEASLGQIIPHLEPALLYEPAKYVLSGGGKRLRPVLLLLTANAFNAEVEEAMPAALAVEVFHNFTLVHDDIMDNASTRRGKPTVHEHWDPGTAILSGDYLMGLSYELLSRTGAGDISEMLRVYHHMVRLLCEGQALDKAFETRSDVTVDEYIYMIDRKTAALLEAVFEIGGIVGGVGHEERNRLSLLGKSVGRAFQIQDDLLDITAENAKWGKKVGGDLIEGKKTYLLLRAIERVEGPSKSFFEKIVAHNGLAEEKIPVAKQLLEENGILEDARKAVLHHTEIAQDCMHVFGDSEAGNAIRWLIGEMQNRMH
ncbi:MAG: polyprenyl synthetase family protein [Rhodothermales bacterium]